MLYNINVLDIHHILMSNVRKMIDTLLVLPVQNHESRPRSNGYNVDLIHRTQLFPIVRHSKTSHFAIARNWCSLQSTCNKVTTQTHEIHVEAYNVGPFTNSKNEPFCHFAIARHWRSWQSTCNKITITTNHDTNARNSRRSRQRWASSPTPKRAILTLHETGVHGSQPATKSRHRHMKFTSKRVCQNHKTSRDWKM